MFQMSDQLTNMGAKSRKSKCIKWANEENYTKPSPPTILFAPVKFFRP